MELFQPKTLDGILDTFQTTLNRLEKFEQTATSKKEMISDQMATLQKDEQKLTAELDRASSVRKKIEELLS